MSGQVGQPERATQNRVIALFRNELGYRYLDDWTYRAGNNNIEEGLLSTWLTARGCSPAQISSALSTSFSEITMKTVNIREGKRRLSTLVDCAVRGEAFVIAKAGKPPS